MALKNVRDKKHFMYLGLYNAYLNATQEPYGYLLLDLTQNTNDGLRIRTNIFPNDTTPLTVYSYVGDEASEDELSYSSGSEYSRPEIALSYYFKL